MRLFLYCFWTCVLVISIYDPVRSNIDEDPDSEEFVATSEWQEVKPGQSIPPGLHVRLDLEKGGRWAKLMDDENSETKSVVALGSKANSKQDDSEKGQKFKFEELKSALKNMKIEKQTGHSEEKKKEIKDKFRSMDEIKSAFEELDLQQETDFEVMKRLLKQYKDPSTSTENKVLVLQDLENYVHQVDNGVDFVKLDGIATMIEALNSTEPSLRLESAHVIGSAVQSNPAVQVKAVEAGAVRTLIHILGDEKQPAEVRKKALYALSCLLRHFPAAQFFFKNAGGFSALTACFNKHGTEKLRLKALSLINDLVVERREHFTSQIGENADERTRQYKLFSLSSVIEDIGLCGDISKMLSTELHDQRDMLLIVMKNLHSVCKKHKDYITKALDNLNIYKRRYRELVAEEEKEGDHDSFFHQVYKNVNDLLELMVHDTPQHSEL